MGRVIRITDLHPDKIKKNNRTQCWEWTGCLCAGYGRVQERPGHKALILAHRLSWQLANGPIPKGLSILHKCDNPPCVNPKHLYAGTSSDNMKDAWDRGRKNNNCHRGPRNPMAKYDVEFIRKIRASKKSLSKISKEFGINKSYVGQIRQRIRWSWLED